MNREHQIVPRWLTLKGAAIYSGLSERTIANYIKADLVVSSNVVMPGNSRGRRLIERTSLDAFIERGIGGKSDIAMNLHG
jgi:hypothetical protein